MLLFNTVRSRVIFNKSTQSTALHATVLLRLSLSCFLWNVILHMWAQWMLLLQYCMCEAPEGMRAQIPGRSLRTHHSLAKMWTFGGFFFLRVRFLFFFRSSLDSLVSIGWDPWFNIKGHVLMCCFRSEHSLLLSVIFGWSWRENCGILLLSFCLQLLCLCPSWCQRKIQISPRFSSTPRRKWSELKLEQNVTELSWK